MNDIERREQLQDVICRALMRAGISAYDGEKHIQALMTVLDRIGKLGSAEKCPSSDLEQALDFWKRLRGFYDRAVRALSRGNELTGEQKKALEKELFVIRVAYLRWYLVHKNQFIRIVAGIEMLPTAVWRRLLWHKNIDLPLDGDGKVCFASCLRRVSPEQAISISLHAHLVYDKIMKGKDVDFLCFTDGWKNIIANRFSRETERYDAKDPLGEQAIRYRSRAAIAHNLFGWWDIGFKLYHGAESDFQNPTTLASQVILSRRGESFSVNTESRGAYWWLYRTPRANSLWGNPDKIELNSHICPGFWATIGIWALFLFISPLCAGVSLLGGGESMALGMLYAFACLGPLLIMSLFVYDDGGYRRSTLWIYAGLFGFTAIMVSLWVGFWNLGWSTAWLKYPVWAIGAITPTILLAFALQWCIQKLSNKYDKNFIQYVCILSIAIFGGSFGGYHVYQLLSLLDWSDPISGMGVTLSILWIAQALSKKKLMWPWKLPVFGPILSAGIILRGGWLLYQYYPEQFWKICIVIAEGIGMVVGMVVGVIACYWLYDKGQQWIKDRAERWKAYLSQRRIDKIKEEIFAIRIMQAYLFVIGCFSAHTLFRFACRIADSGLMFVLGEILGSLSQILIITIAVVFLPMSILYLGLMFHEREKIDPMRFEAIQVAGNCKYSMHTLVVQALLSNPTFRIGFGQLDPVRIEMLMSSKNHELLRDAYHWHDSEYLWILQAMTVKTLKYFCYIELPEGESHLLPLIARGMWYEEAREAYRKQQKRKQAWDAFCQTIARVFSAPKVLIQGVENAADGLMAAKEWFDHSCPHIEKSKWAE